MLERRTMANETRQIRNRATTREAYTKRCVRRSERAGHRQAGAVRAGAYWVDEDLRHQENVENALITRG